MNRIEIEEILDNALDWIFEHCESNEKFYQALKDIGMTDKEIKKEKERIEVWE